MSLDELLAHVKCRSEAEQLKLLRQIVCDLLRACPNQEIAILDEGDEPIAYCVPDALYRPSLSPEQRAAADRHSPDPVTPLTWPELRSKLEAMSHDQEKVA